MKKGATRLVFKIGVYVVKIPNFLYNHLNFLNGCYSNYSERQYCKMFKKMPEFYDLVAPSLFCSIFGLIQIQRFCSPLNSEISEQDLIRLENVRKGESKSTNFGVFKGKIVCVDFP